MCIKMKSFGKQLTATEVARIYEINSFWYIESPPLVIKRYKDGRRQMFVTIQNIRYLIKQDKHSDDKWYEVIDNGSNK